MYNYMRIYIYTYIYIYIYIHMYIFIKDLIERLRGTVRMDPQHIL